MKIKTRTKVVHKNVSQGCNFKKMVEKKRGHIPEQYRVSESKFGVHSAIRGPKRGHKLPLKK
jgi:hypothetical protein